MTVTIELSEEQAAALKQQAEGRGLTVERWLQQVAAQLAPSTSRAHLQETDPEEWARRFHEYPVCTPRSSTTGRWFHRSSWVRSRRQTRGCGRNRRRQIGSASRRG